MELQLRSTMTKALIMPLAGSIAALVPGPVTATSSGGVVTIRANTNHANTFYAVSVSISSDRPDIFPSCSFALSSTNVTGGSDPTYYTLYDTGTVTATTNGFSKSTSYGQSSTPGAVASGLASAFNGDG